LRITIL